MGMLKNKLQQLVSFVKDYIRSHYKEGLPYGAILLFLIVIWFFWNNSTGQIRQTTGETKHSQEVSTPVFVSQKQGERKGTATDAASSTGTAKEDGENLGTLVYGTSTVRRSRPLPDLFSHTLTAEAVQPTTAPTPSTEHAGLQKTKKQPVLPRSCGVMESDDTCLVILQSGQETRPCAVGDRIDDYTVVYINTDYIGLEKNGEIIEIRK
jgi:hypothetical protein